MAANPTRAEPSLAEGAAAETLFELRFRSLPDRLKMVRAAVAAAVRSTGCSEDAVHDIVLAVDEACQNVIRHAYSGRPDGEIVLTMRREGDRVAVELRDFAPPVDERRVRPRDLDELRPGGLGTHLIREVMDEVAFLPRPAGGGNLLRMVKRIAPTGAAAGKAEGERP